ncbi:MAG: hypothetical protein IH988_08120 [Planctomycetes bacterium]|nr:hypothetical protein [Planctomycetota bacterium]
MTICTKTIVGLAAGVWAASGTVLAGGENLRARFLEGTESYYIRTINTTTKTSVDEDSGLGEIQDSIELGMRFRVLDAKEDGSAILECTVLYVDLAFIEGGRVIGYDSRTGRSIGRAGWKDRLLLLVNKPVLLHLDAAGRVSKIESPAMDDDGRRQHPKFEAIVSDAVLQQLPLFATAGAPAPIAAKASWKGSFRTDLAMSTSRMLVDYAFTVTELKDSLAKVSWTSSFRGDDSPAPKPRPDQMTKVEVKEGSGSGDLTWDVGEGRLQSSKSESRVKLAEFMPGAPPDQPLYVEQTSSEILKRVTLADFKLPTPPKPKPKPEAKEPEPESKPESKPEPEIEGTAPPPNSDTAPTSDTPKKGDTEEPQGSTGDADKNPS